MPRKRKTGVRVRASNPALEEKLIQNLIELQKIHTTLLERFDKLSVQISSLLNLFEMTARSFGENPVNQVSQKDREFLEKIDKLLEQNKTIAKGLTLMEEKTRERVYGKPSPNSSEEFHPSMHESPSSTPLPHF